MKILVFTTDVIPLKGLPTSGTALRTFGFIQGLRAHGHEVVVSVPKQALQGLKRCFETSGLAPSVVDEIRELEANAFSAENQDAVLARVSPDAILCGHWPAMQLSVKPEQPLIIDLAGPHLLERHYQGSPDQMGAALGKLSALSTADYFIVSGPSQRLYFLSFLLRAEVERAEERIITIPMPLNPNLPVRKGADTARDTRFVFGGVFLPWQDPSHSLTALVKELEDRKRGSLKLIGGKHPNYKIDNGVYEKLFKSLSESSYVNTKPMLPYEQFIDELLHSDVAIDLMRWNLERQLAVTIRTTTYLWAGVPIIYNDFADLAALIKEYDAGWTIDPESDEAFKKVINEIYSKPELVLAKSKNAQRLAHEVFSWDKAVEPLLSLISGKQEYALKETDIVIDFPQSADFPLLSEQSVEQHFLCRVDGLSKIEFRLATHDRENVSPLRLSLYEVKDSSYKKKQSRPADSNRELIKEIIIDGTTIKNNEWCTFELTSPLKTSAGKCFVFQVTSEQTELDKSISPWAVRGNPYPLLGMYYGGKYIEQTCLCFKTQCIDSQKAL